MITVREIKPYCLLVLLSLFLFCSSSLKAKEQQYDYILALNAYSESSEWSNSVITPAMHLISEMSQTNIFIEHLNMVFLDSNATADVFGDKLFAKYETHPPKIIFLIGNRTLYYRDRIKEMWGDIPIILCGEKDYIGSLNFFADRAPMSQNEKIPLQSISQEYNLTYLEMPAYEIETVDLMNKMIPDMKKFVFISGQEYYNQEYSQAISSYIAAKYPQIEYERISPEDVSLTELLGYLNHIDPKETGILFSSWLYKAEAFGNNVSIITNAHRILANLSIPIFSLRYAGPSVSGLVGGYMYSDEALIEKLLNTINAVNNGKEPRTIPFYYSEYGTPVFDYEALTKKGLSPDRCPPESIFYNKPSSVWERYKWIILTVITALFIVLIVQQSRIKMLGKLKAAKQKEYELIQRYKDLINGMPILYLRQKIIRDEQGNFIDTEFCEANPSFENVFYPKEEAVGKRNSELFPEVAKDLLHFMQLSVKEKRTITFSFYFKRTDRFYDLVITNANDPDMIDTFGVDSTNLQRTQQQLSLTNRKLSLALDVASIVPWKWDLEKKLILCDVNKPIEFAGIEAVDDERFSVPDTAYFNKIFKEDREKVQRAYQDLIEGRKSKIREEYRVVARGANNTHHMEWVEAQATVDSYDASGKPQTLVGSSLVITHRKRMEQELVSAKDRAEESNRLKSAFLANMSHEIRTPLNAIVGFSSILAATEEENEKQKYVNIIENNNTLLLQLISDILDLSKIEAGTLEFAYTNIELNNVLKELEKTLSMKVDADKVKLSFNQPLPELYIRTEKNRITQVLINLLTNAIKFTPEGSITFGYEHRGKEVYFYVKDTGCGIPQEQKEHIFDRFIKLNAFAQGSGLGLSICQTIIKYLDGEMGVDSEEGKGSTFWFTIPYIKGDSPERIESEQITPIKVQKDKLTILIAEDNESNYMLFESILKQDYRLIHAWDGEEAVEMFHKYQPHIVLMDINMPKMNGYEATQAIRKESDKVPIIAVTAYAYTSDEQRAMDNGFNGYMSKPINPSNLRNKLIDVMETRFILF